MMGILGDKKKVLAQILGADPREKTEGASQADALEVLAQELMDALGSGDAKSAAQSLRSCWAECNANSQTVDGGPEATGG